MKNKRKKFWIILFVGLILLFAGYQVTLRYFSEDNRRIRTSLREALKEMYPAEADALRAGYGIKPAGGSMEVDGSPGVILVHGLDEPGRVWMNLTPVLLDRGFHVWMLSYPNDQPIAESARFFLDELTLLREKGPEKISIVAFSMGGLVALLYCEKYRYQGGTPQAGWNSIISFIMCDHNRHEYWVYGDKPKHVIWLCDTKW